MLANNQLHLNHLLPRVHKIAILPNEDRIQHIRKDRWVGYTRATEALDKLEALLSHPPRQRMPNLLIIGPTNNGKSMIIKKFIRKYPQEENNSYNIKNQPVVVVQMPSDPKITRFYSMLIHSLDTRLLSPSARISDLEAQALRVLKKIKTKILVIDEVHNLLAGTSGAQREFLNLLRFLGNQLNIPIVCVGTKEAYYAIRTDDQLENRFEPLILPRWQDDDELVSLLASISSILPLRKPSFLNTPELIRFILDKSEGTIGEIMTLLTRAAIIAIESGEEMINKTILAHVDYKSPTERRHTFERILT